MSPDTLLQDFRRLQTAHISPFCSKANSLSLLQMLSLLWSVSVKWPNLLKEFISGITASISFTSNLQSIECLVRSFGFGSTHADFTFLMLIGSSLLPILMCLFLCIHWFVLAPWCCRTLSCGVKMRPGGFICTIPKDIQGGRNHPVASLSSLSQPSISDVSAFLP